MLFSRRKLFLWSPCLCGHSSLSPSGFFSRIQDIADLVQDAELSLAGDHGIDPGRVDAGVSQDIGQVDDVVLSVVVGDGKEVAEVVGKDLFSLDAGGLGEPLHPAVDDAPVDGSAAAGDEDRAARDAAFPAVGAQLPAEGVVEEDDAGLALEGDGRPACRECADCDKGQLADADPGAGQGLYDQAELAAARLSSAGPAPGCPHEVLILLDREVFFRAAKGDPLGLEDHDTAFLPAHELEKGVQGRQHGVGAGDPVVFLQVLLEPAHGLPVHCVAGAVLLLLSRLSRLRFFEPYDKGPHIPRVLFNGCIALFMIPE